MCDGVENSREAIEFAMRNDVSRNGRWIPLKLSYHHAISIEAITSVRGYQVNTENWPSGEFNERVVICGELFSDVIQFRWMGSANFDGGYSFRQDMWALTAVNATFVTAEGTITLIQETFGTSILK